MSETPTTPTPDEEAQPQAEPAPAQPAEPDTEPDSGQDDSDAEPQVGRRPDFIADATGADPAADGEAAE